jgi:short-subunit dehydrogenase
LILNAGIAHKSFAEETLEEVDRRIMEVNFMGNILLTKKIIPIMKKNGSGTIAVTSSILGKIGLPLVSTYCASKQAVTGYYESLRYEIAKYDINITILSPGFIKTDITKNSLTADGKVFNKDSIAQEKGMNAHLCAKKMIQAIQKGKRHEHIGGLETFMPAFSFFFPQIFFFLMKKMHKI